jgi:hypothetical protein
VRSRTDGAINERATLEKMMKVSVELLKAHRALPLAGMGEDDNERSEQFGAEYKRQMRRGRLKGNAARAAALEPIRHSDIPRIILALPRTPNATRSSMGRNRPLRAVFNSLNYLNYLNSVDRRRVPFVPADGVYSRKSYV